MVKLIRQIFGLSKAFRFKMNSIHNVAVSGFNQQYFSYIMATSLSGGRSRREPPTIGKQLGSHYDSNRPSYTDQAVRYVIDLLSELSTLNRKDLKCDVLELGAGTGKFTEKITACIAQDVKYLATEPSDSFLTTLRSKVPSFVECAACTANALPLPNYSVKLIIAAQCFHWFASPESLQEIYRVLVPGGRFVMVWNNKDWSVPWVKSMEDILTQYYDEDTPRAVTYKWKHVIESFTGFTLKCHQLLPGIEMKGDRDFIVSHFSTISVIAMLSEEERQEVLTRFHKVLETNEQTQHHSEIQIPFCTEIYDVEKTVL